MIEQHFGQCYALYSNALDKLREMCENPNKSVQDMEKKLVNFYRRLKNEELNNFGDEFYKRIFSQIEGPENPILINIELT